jgi:hypothetical protein
MAKPTGRSWTLLLTVMATVLISVPTAVWASHQFTDVPDSHIFHTGISWMKDNNITVGCNPPANTQYCPEDNVTRGEMATFMKRLAENNVVDAATLDGLDSTDFVATDLEVEAHYTCAGTAHRPYDSAATFTASGSLRIHSSGTGIYRCNTALPDGAVVTSVAYSVRDAAAGGDIECEMWRTNLVTSIGTETEMVSVLSSGTPGESTITDNTITAPTIDNENYGYFTQCRFPITGSTMGLWGATITYSHNPTTASLASAEPDAPSGGGSGE